MSSACNHQLVEADVTLEVGERARSEVEDNVEVPRLHQVAAARAIDRGVAAGAAEHRDAQPHAKPFT